MAWAKDRGASSFCHWAQPLGASGLRPAMTMSVQNCMVDFDAETGSPVWGLSGKQLLRGETDGSSYPNGGLRATHTAGAALLPDTSSPIFLRGDTVFIPSALISVLGHSLDEKTPLLRANDALTREGTRLLKLLGLEANSLVTNIGLEQEYFLIPRDAYLKRPDLQLAGRTVLGRFPARGQELCDHYMAPPSLASPALAFMQDVQQQCYQLGIPLRTRHREVAPNQYEFAPMFGPANIQIDQNLLVMQIMDETAAKYGLAALLQEKPFQGVNGSGKHNNWSIATDSGINLLNAEQLGKIEGGRLIFTVVLSAIIQAVNQHGDLMRLAIASPGNDFRLGACEAPPAIMSTYLGDELTQFLEAFRSGKATDFVPGTRKLNTGASALPVINVPREDRNRTSPFPYGGHRFEFRAVGSSQNVSLVNTILATITAQAFKKFADAIQAGETPVNVAKKALDENWRVIFNGNGYAKENQEKLTAAGVWKIDSGVDAIARFTAPKNVALFQELHVLTEAECHCRETVMFNQYWGTVEIEAVAMRDMLAQHVIPSARAAGVATEHLVPRLVEHVHQLEQAVAEIHHAETSAQKAALARELRLNLMQTIRATSDETEGLVPASLWTLATYKELWFLDKL